MRIFGVDEEPGEDVFVKVVSVAEKAFVVSTSSEVSTCHRLTLEVKAQSRYLPSLSDVILNISC